VNPGRGTLSAGIALVLAFAACAASVFWVVGGVAPWSGGASSNVWHHYEYMAEGFARGHTYLSVDPDPALLRLRDPYDPAANARLRLWDASLYKGRYYLYYGPGPAVAVMLPWRIVSGRMLAQATVVALFAVAGLAGLALLLWEVRRKCFPELSGAAMGAIFVVAFHAAWLPVILRRPGVWELPIVSAAACLWWALYFLWKFRDSGGRTRWAAATGAALALLIACRVTNLPEAGLILLLLLLPFDGGAGKTRRWTGPLAAAALVGGCGVALLIYNLERFGSWREFGQSYMLGGRDIRASAFLNPSYIPFNMWTYLTSLPEMGPYFPFLHATWPAAFPPGYLDYEAMYGALFAMPVHLAGVLALAWAWRARAQAGTRASVVMLAAAASSTFIAAAILFCWQGACSRYIAELFAGWTLATSVGLMAAFGAGAGRRPGRAARVLAACAACWSVGCVWLASAEFRGFMRQTNPGTYAAVGRALDYPSEWWIRLRDIRFAPVDLDVRVPAGAPRGETVLLASGFPEKVNQLVIDRVDEGHARLILNGNEDSVLETPLLAVPDGRLRVRLSVPWLYPPPEHPFWDRVADASRRRELQTLFCVDWGAGMASAHSAHAFDAAGFEPVAQGARGADPGSPYVESVRRLPQAR
jgi:hypothetical protein